MLKPCVLLVATFLAGCAAYYPVAPAGPDPHQAQSLANERCAKSGKVAVMIRPAACNSDNCTTTFECR